MGMSKRRPTKTDASRRMPSQWPRHRNTLKWFALGGLVLLFFVSISLLGEALDRLAGSVVSELLSATSNPFVGLFVGILATSVIQSSSTVTSLTVGIVAGGGLEVAQAIPIVMGSNMGTSVTNALVAAGQLNRPNEFRRAFAAAVVDDFFELCSLVILFPLQLVFNVLGVTATFFANAFRYTGGLNVFDPLRLVIDPMVAIMRATVLGSGVAMLILALALLFASLYYLMQILRYQFVGKIERLFNEALFNSAGRALLLGFAVTVAIQSSSLTTSLVIPLAAAGFLTLGQIFPYALGANIGTTLTAMLAALVTGVEAAVTVAFAHLLYNIFGTALLWPVRWIPISLARTLALWSSRHRMVALVYVALVFFCIPAALVAVSG